MAHYLVVVCNNLKLLDIPLGGYFVLIITFLVLVRSNSNTELIRKMLGNFHRAKLEIPKIYNGFSHTSTAKLDVFDSKCSN